MTIPFRGKIITIDDSEKTFIKMGFKKLRSGDKVKKPPDKLVFFLLGFGQHPYWNWDVLWYTEGENIDFWDISVEQQFESA